MGSSREEENAYDPRRNDLSAVRTTGQSRTLRLRFAASRGPVPSKTPRKLGIDPGFFADTDGRLYLVMYKGEIHELARGGLGVKRLVAKIDTSRYNCLGLIITRVDVKESSDPFGRYVIRLHPDADPDPNHGSIEGDEVPERGLIPQWSGPLSHIDHQFLHSSVQVV